MKDRIAYQAPFAVLLVLGVFFALQYYIPHPLVQGPKEMILQWKQPMNAFIMLIALFGLGTFHARKIKKREARWGYSAVTLVSMVAMFATGMIFGTEDGSVFSDWFKHLITPIESTMFALLAFYIASAAFRAFKARTVGATVLLVSAAVVMLGLIPAVEDAVPGIARASEFILKYPNTAAKRAILMGVALGAVSVAIKTIFGIDRTVLDRDR